MTGSDCPDREELRQYALGTLPESRAVALEEHFQRCPACETTVCALENLSDTLIAALRRPARTRYKEFFADPAFVAAVRRVRALGPSSDAGVADAPQGAAGPRDVEAGLVLGNYVVLEEIGKGGMGRVYKARHKKMNRVVALKVLPPAATESAEAMRRFQREVEAAAKLSHVNIVAAYDADEAQGLHFLAMEYVVGKDLGSRVRELGPLGVPEAVDCILQAARGLEYAHLRGIVHRDIKPSNFLQDSGGTVKVLDMGLARIDDPVGAADDPVGATDDDLTHDGQLMGTLAYMSPEQALDAHHVDARSDIYSLGCTLYYLLAGRPPYEGGSVAKKILMHRDQPVPALRAIRPEVPESLEAVFQKMLAKKPDQRQASMTQVIAELEACRVAQRASPSAQGPRAGQGAILQRITRRRKIVVAAALGLGFLLSLSALILKLRTAEGTLTVEVDEADVTVQVLSDGGKVQIERKADPRQDVATFGREPPPAGAPFDAAEAKRHQKAWAAYLGVPVENANSIGMKLVLIPPGEFPMGFTTEEIAWATEQGKNNKQQRWYVNRVPSGAARHRVKIGRPFYLGMYEVTQGEYRQVMGVNPSRFAATAKEASAPEPPLSQKQKDEKKSLAKRLAGQDITRHPVDMVSWQDAVEFCRRLSALPKEQAAQRVYRLPTEAEWEYACRAGTTTRWSCGDDEAGLLDHAWLNSNSTAMTHPVGQKKPNAWGLYDMHGNVWEWCADWLGKDYYKGSPPIDPAGPPLGSSRVLRGGAWNFGPPHGCSALRFSGTPSLRADSYGFRVVCGR